MEHLRHRKRMRLQGYNYSRNGAYFITICTKDRRKLLGDVVWHDASNTSLSVEIVGRDAPGAPLPSGVPFLRLSKYGGIVKAAIEETPTYYHGVTIDNFVVMPNHIHMIICIDRENGSEGAPRASRPTNALIPNIIAALKKKTNKSCGLDMWQTSYYDHIIRNEPEYLKIWQYIDENPINWMGDRYYVTGDQGRLT